MKMADGIYSFIASENGVRKVDIALKMKTSPSAVGPYLTDMLAAGKIISKKPLAGFAYKYYANHKIVNDIWRIQPDVEWRYY